MELCFNDNSIPCISFYALVVDFYAWNYDFIEIVSIFYNMHYFGFLDLWVFLFNSFVGLFSLLCFIYDLDPIPCLFNCYLYYIFPVTNSPSLLVQFMVTRYRSWGCPKICFQFYHIPRYIYIKVVIINLHPEGCTLVCSIFPQLLDTFPHMVHLYMFL